MVTARGSFVHVHVYVWDREYLGTMETAVILFGQTSSKFESDTVVRSMRFYTFCNEQGNDR